MKIDATELAPGLITVRYESPEDLMPGQQAGLLEQLEAAARKGKTALLFVLASSLRGVSLDVPSFWLGVTGESRYRLAAMAIVSPSSAVRAAAKGFDLANRVRGLPLAVRPFTDEAEARAWVLEELARAASL